MEEKMLQKALETMEHAYVPYSNFKVGVCLRTADGEFFIGCNVENVSYGLTQCAEASAVGNMVSHRGRQPIKEVVIVSSGGQVIYPCGGCRQRLAEFSDQETLFHFYGSGGKVVHLTMKELLPYSFNPTHLGMS